MRGPQPPTIDLADAERQELEHLVRRHTTPQQLALRARIVLAAADGANNCQIARQLDVSRIWYAAGANVGWSCSQRPWTTCRWRTG